MSNTSLNAVIAKALGEIGITAVETPGADGFLPGIEIVAGTLHYDPDCPPGNLLHDPGHIAIVPKSLRHHLTADIESILPIFEEILHHKIDNPDHPMCRACIQASDPEVTAWGYAFGKKLGIPDDPHVYQGDGANIIA